MRAREQSDRPQHDQHKGEDPMSKQLKSDTLIAEWNGKPEHTDIDGIVHVDDDGHRYYVVSFELVIEADNVEQASQRAMSFRERVSNPGRYDTPSPHFDVPGDWHLHDHDGC
jgi:hypothetical protein